MYGKVSKPRKLLWPIIAGAAFGGWVIYSGSDWKLSLLGFVPAVLFAAIFLWAVISEKRI
ncbi:MAG: hypothetical protein CMM10_12190 [Rhodospirillaceae bacterium]|jgi:membrane protein implicated in regulation of membrane protease activity|nr:hypothetical protein [Rhodospirillaceae bacterium]|tara:strand:- start:1922 stop:2101 length:180 start_codon:yes stop_codon:yes gene_type:complete